MSKRRKKIRINTSIYSSSSSDDDTPIFVIEQKIEVPKKTIEDLSESSEGEKAHSEKINSLGKIKSDDEDSTSSCDDPFVYENSEKGTTEENLREQLEESLSIESLLEKSSISIEEEDDIIEKVVERLTKKNIKPELLLKCYKKMENPKQYNLEVYCELLMHEFLGTFKQTKSSTKLSYITDVAFPKWLEEKTIYSLKFPKIEIALNVKSWKKPDLAEFIRKMFKWRINNDSARQWRIFNQDTSEKVAKICLHGKSKSQCKKCNLCKNETKFGRCDVETSPTFKYKYCYACGCFLFGRTPSEKRQDIVFRFLKEVFANTCEIRYDQVIPNQNCNKFRPDALFLLNFRKLIIECDENQHKASYYSCESKRMNEIATSGEILPTIFIRFNPDMWNDENRIKRKIPLNTKLENLKLEIEHWMNIENQQEHPCQIIYLYYDGEQRQESFVPI